MRTVSSISNVARVPKASAATERPVTITLRIVNPGKAGPPNCVAGSIWIDSVLADCLPADRQGSNGSVRFSAAVFSKKAGKCLHHDRTNFRWARIRPHHSNLLDGLCRATALRHVKLWLSLQPMGFFPKPKKPPQVVLETDPLARYDRRHCRNRSSCPPKTTHVANYLAGPDKCPISVCSAADFQCLYRGRRRGKHGVGRACGRKIRNRRKEE